jgi:hypothetical protein
MGKWKRYFVAAITAILIVMPLTPAGATPPVDLEIENHLTFSDIPSGEVPFTGEGPFVATGSAVEAGLVCPSGESLVVDWRQTAFQPPTEWVNFHVITEFTCDDGSGVFYIQLQVRADQKGDNANWRIAGGTGVYERLRGTGKAIGLPFAGGVDDFYSGTVHND